MDLLGAGSAQYWLYGKSLYGVVLLCTWGWNAALSCSSRVVTHLW